MSGGCVGASAADESGEEAEEITWAAHFENVASAEEEQQWMIQQRRPAEEDESAEAASRGPPSIFLLGSKRKRLLSYERNHGYVKKVQQHILELCKRGKRHRVLLLRCRSALAQKGLQEVS